MTGTCTQVHVHIQVRNENVIDVVVKLYFKLKKQLKKRKIVIVCNTNYIQIPLELLFLK